MKEKHIPALTAMYAGFIGIPISAGFLGTEIWRAVSNEKPLLTTNPFLAGLIAFTPYLLGGVVGFVRALKRPL